MTRIRRIFADFIRVYPLNPRHPRSINDYGTSSNNRIF